MAGKMEIIIFMIFLLIFVLLILLMLKGWFYPIRGYYIYHPYSLWSRPHTSHIIIYRDSTDYGGIRSSGYRAMSGGGHGIK